MLAKYLTWDVVAMAVALVIIFTLEMLGIFGRHYVTLTLLARTFIPRWARAMICGWLMYHFVIT